MQEGQKDPLAKIALTQPMIMKLGTLTPYLKISNIYIYIYIYIYITRHNARDLLTSACILYKSEVLLFQETVIAFCIDCILTRSLLFS